MRVEGLAPSMTGEDNDGDAQGTKNRRLNGGPTPTPSTNQT
jgi:hypothetical protein